MSAIQQSQASTGILIGVRQQGKPAVLLQVRAEHDSYPGACQVTTHGKLTEDELRLDKSDALATAIGRKLRDELGSVAAEMVEAALSSPVDLEEFVNSKGRLVVTRGIDLGIEASAFAKLIVRGKDVGGFRPCTDPNTIQPLEDAHKKEGVPAKETRMFEDEIKAVKEFFRRVFNS